ncbi:MAG: tRNA (adenosine(37)-N6)-threonylcarbamoyltransferase complex ATPase subunit type 1 TsaE [Rhodospirillaceae bacterium]|jgi:tRNA threonylcarbamoyladenosine biosynthesis protein TsaE|nr:tRNA (adenosine(37)-N6)-threonylcarbamoyltransferase complex ATPase subunit type 1 TsaE [Rhodospirillaceae bacterium]
MAEPVNPYQFTLKNENATAALATKLAGIAEPGDVIALIGDLGAGKTSFARAFVAAKGGDGEVPSPTFTLVQLYEFANGDVYHFDLYRLEEADEIFELGIEDAMSDGISLIEWPDRMGAYLPVERLDIVLGIGQEEAIREVELIDRGDSWADRLAKAFPDG